MEGYSMDIQEWRSSPYSWHQSHDQATVLLMVPFEATEEDISVTIGCNYIVAGVSGQAPIIKGRLYGQVDSFASSWQLESQPQQFRPSPRERTTSTTSVTSATSGSTHSSFAFVSDPEISSSFAASLENRDASSSPALSSSPPDRSLALYRHLSIAPPYSHHVSPRHSIHSSSSSSFSSLDSSFHNTTTRGYTGKLLTLHLEKCQTVIWPSLIVGPVPDAVTSPVCFFNSAAVSEEVEQRYNMDPTSLTLIALELLDIRKDKEEAFECLIRAWHLAHAPTATMKLVSCYFPIHFSYGIPEDSKVIRDNVQRGTQTYYLQCIGGRTGLARLYIEAGMLYLEGTASSLVSSSHSSLASIRVPLQPNGSLLIGHGGGTDAWRRDRIAAARLFERARALQPGLETPALPLSSSGSVEELDLELDLHMQMPSIELDNAHCTDPFQENGLQNRRRRGKEQEDFFQTHKGSGALVGKAASVEDSSWYMLLPGLVGAGTALVIVGVVGALSLSWSRRNQGS